MAHVVDFYERRPDEQGLVLFFTGLSGSGKSTLAQALMDRLLEQGARTVTSLDGDVVRRNLSAGLTFSKEDRETNIRRIGWVAAEISRHGGLAVCSPIAPFDETRQQVRAMVDDAGGAFFLVHVATPLEECERRDRKGLYAKARRGEIPEFTGISSPYEEPADADVRVDTTGRTIDDALDDVISGAARGRLPRPRRDSGGRGRARGERPDRSSPPTQRAAQRPLRVHGEHLPLAVHGDHRARTWPAPTPRWTFSSAGTHGFREYAMDAVMAGTLTERGLSADGVPEPAADRRPDRGRRPGPHRRGLAPGLHPRRPRRGVPQGVHARPGRRGAAQLTRAAWPGRTCCARSGSAAEPPSRSLDVRDPYGAAPRPPSEAAEQIDELLRVVVPALAGSRRIQT